MFRTQWLHKRVNNNNYIKGHMFRCNNKKNYMCTLNNLFTKVKNISLCSNLHATAINTLKWPTNTQWVYCVFNISRHAPHYTQLNNAKHNVKYIFLFFYLLSIKILNERVINDFQIIFWKPSFCCVLNLSLYI